LVVFIAFGDTKFCNVAYYNFLKRMDRAFTDSAFSVAKMLKRESKWKKAKISKIIGLLSWTYFREKIHQKMKWTILKRVRLHT